jgi:hypothetical protein
LRLKEMCFEAGQDFRGPILVRPGIFIQSIDFIVYDPEIKIRNDTEFINGFQDARKNCYVRIYR